MFEKSNQSRKNLTHSENEWLNKLKLSHEKSKILILNLRFFNRTKRNLSKISNPNSQKSQNIEIWSLIKSNNLNHPVHQSLRRLNSNIETKSINLSKNMKRHSLLQNESFKKQLIRLNRIFSKWDHCLKLTSRIFWREFRRKKTRLRDISMLRLKSGSQD